jgi:ATP-dependent DNA ligase
MLPKLSPMLAVPAAPFDSSEYTFEIKWDGVRALAAVEATGWRLWGRQRTEYSDRYPELEVLRRLPAETLMDGELVAFDAEGRPDLPRLLRRHGLTDSWRIRQARHWCPVRYVVFDLLYHRGRCLVREPLARRREVLAELCHRLNAADVQFSAGVIGAGKALYEAAIAHGHEGVMAKHVTSTYRPGRRSAAWRKIKPRQKGIRREIPTCYIWGAVPHPSGYICAALTGGSTYFVEGSDPLPGRDSNKRPKN